MLTNAQDFHSLTHVNAAGLKQKYQITWRQAKDTVQHCPQCQVLQLPHEGTGVNPWVNPQYVVVNGRNPHTFIQEICIHPCHYR